MDYLQRKNKINLQTEKFLNSVKTAMSIQLLN